jgi:L-aspartate oxidase
VGAGDSPADHARDTLGAGAELCRPDAVALLTSSAPAHVRRLLALGTRFDRTVGGDLALGREAAHGRPRILHANGDGTGQELVRALADAVRAAPHVVVSDHTEVDRLHVADGRVLGVWTRGATGSRTLVLARAVVLATGGCGQLYRHTTNPPEATGDGLVLAARAGAVLADLEFVQFHPTALAVGADPLPLVTEALRGAGATLVDERGHRFMLDAHPDAELAPRDVVARAAWRHAAEGHRVFLDARAALGDAFPDRFPAVFDACRRHGLDPRREPLPVTPAAHYHLGGVATDLRGRTSLAGLWACGEVASTGVHGANRLASNSLLEALVFGAVVAEDVGGAPRDDAGGHASAAGDAARPAAGGPCPAAPATALTQVARVRQLMWEHVGLVRTEAGLSHAIAELRAIEQAAPSPGVRDLALLARLVATAARAREESRGSHWRTDWPTPRARWHRRQFVQLAADGAVRAVSPSAALAGSLATQSLATWSAA